MNIEWKGMQISVYKRIGMAMGKKEFAKASQK